MISSVRTGSASVHSEREATTAHPPSSTPPRSPSLRVYPLPAPRLLVLLALAAPLFLIGDALALAVNGLILTFAVIDLRLTPGGTRVRVTRRVPDRVALDEGMSMEYRIQNVTGLRTQLRLTDDLAAGLVREGNDRLETVLEPWGGVHLSSQARAVTRGTTAVGDVHLRVLGPLGLVWRAERRTLVDRVRVQPGLTELRGNRLRGLRERLVRAGRHSVFQREDRGAFESLREYVRGDDPRTIDWKATAKRRTTIVRRYEAERSQNVVVMIDAGRLMTERIEGRERLDYALAAALVLADTAAAGGDHVGLLVFSDRIEHYLPPGRLRLSQLADTLAETHARLVEPDYPAAFAHLSSRLRRRSLLVLFSDVIDARASAALIQHLSRTTRRHLPLAIALRNPELSAASTRATRGTDVFDRIAAEELLQERATALTHMQHAGILVADTPPDQAVTTTVNRYLEVKQQGRL